MIGLKVLGTGSYVPDQIVTNDMMADIVDTSDEWIVTRTGIKSRCIARRDTNFSMAEKACAAALAQAGINPEEIGVVISATMTGDYYTPSLSCLLQEAFGFGEEILAFDVNAACSGFVYTMELAVALLRQRPGKCALITGCDMLSKIVDYQDRSTCVLFGDGAGAAVVKAEEGRPFYFCAGAKGNHQVLYCSAPRGSENPFREEKKDDEKPVIHMNGSEVFRFAVESFQKSVLCVLEQAGLKTTDIDHFVCHQANGRILHAAAKKLRVPVEKFFMNLDKRGNTSAASIPIALDELHKSGMLLKNNKVVLSGFGGGLTYGSVYFIW